VTRPEGWFLAAALWMSQLFRYLKNREPALLRHLMISIALLVLLLTPYCLITFYYTGGILPSTVPAKAVFFAEMALPFSARASYLGFHLLRFMTDVLFPAPFIMLGLAILDKKISRVAFVWIYIGLFYICYLELFPGSVGHYWGRYQHIFIPIVLIAVAGGVTEATQRRRTFIAKAAVTAVLTLSFLWNQTAILIGSKTVYAGAIKNSESVIVELATWLKVHTPEDALIATHDIGAIGYLSDRKIIDLVGLINPEISPYYGNIASGRLVPLPQRKIVDYLKEKRPDYLVMFRSWDRYFNLLTRSNRKVFRPVHITRPVYAMGSRYMVYKCYWDLPKDNAPSLRLDAYLSQYSPLDR